MSEKYTTVELIGWGAGPGLSLYGTKAASTAIKEYRALAKEQFAEAKAVLEAPDDAFRVYTHRGTYVQTDKKVLREGRVGTVPRGPNE